MDPFLAYILLGIALIVIGVFSMIKGNKNKSRRTVSTVGTVIEVVEKMDIRTDKAGEARRYRYFPTYSYGVNGRRYTCKGVYAYDDKNRFRVGDTALIWYDPANPSDAATQEAGKAKGKAGVVFIILGIAFCVLACTQLG